ncbi:hypothetical protein CROQUDRAFT_710434 [Cronartium quercuum f. sp. fusiforme G11]|uniref:Endonuclease/exonuclease/phosphatase domain-containing protein n=1 Tax=Cronartium quercuum f. sp. fusiforme G11 TaxID=708437 RepID=A0A9P6NIC1_9BASI|nr:hypothetical protein CROQUDRAFT_710434 [Cronartium quercuum f. sp. fusiforme G11]
MEAELFIESLVEQNSLVQDGDIIFFRWLGNPVEVKKDHGSMVLNVTNKELARKIEKGGLFYNYEYLQGVEYNRPSVFQCFRCLEVGHIAALCKAAKPTCVRCGKDHDLKNLRTCIYISKNFLMENITRLPSNSQYLMAMELLLPDSTQPKICIISFYNRPNKNDSLLLLQDWLTNHLDRQTLTFMGMDANLHHTHWNPAHSTHVHPNARVLLKICGMAGFKVVTE